ncbi:MAG: methionine adenosyltransferase [bacterium]
MKRHLFTSESVTEGHPDKICDRISDAVLDDVMKKDPAGRVACETSITTGLVLVAGEITTKAHLDIPDIVRDTIKEIGYTRAEYGFDAETCGVVVAVDRQSPDISMGVDRAQESRARAAKADPFDTQGAGDQGMVFGFACNETKELMPAPIVLAHRICRRLAYVRKNGAIPYLRPDGKSQVTVVYENGRPVMVDTVLISTQHSEDVDIERIRADLMKHVVRKVIPRGMLTPETKYFVNPTGRFVVGGPKGDTGLTGRKIIVDTYGGYSRHGGGAFSGKDPSKVDRSGTYMARYAAKNIVASRAADRCEIQVSYAIGVARPVSVMIETFGTERAPVDRIERAFHEVFDFRPAAIIRNLRLRRPIFKNTAAYGHFGREEPEFTWERTDKAKKLGKILNVK